MLHMIRRRDYQILPLKWLFIPLLIAAVTSSDNNRDHHDIGGSRSRKGLLSISSLLDVSGDLFDDFVDMINYWDVCPFRDEISKSLNTTLSKRIVGQPAGLETIVEAFAAWEFNTKMGYSGPLVLAISGPTGVGKTESSFRIAEAVLKKRDRIENSARFIPRGLLTFRGEELALSSTSSSSTDIEGFAREMQMEVRCKLAAHLQRCQGNAIVVFDEVQKVVPGALEALMPSLEDRGYVSCPTVEQGRHFSTANVAFLFISDIGADRMIKLLLRFTEREKIPRNILRSEVKSALDAQWQRLRLGKMINDVVPFLPLEQPHIKEIMRLKVREISAAHRHVHWMGLLVDDEVLDHFCEPLFIHYSTNSISLRTSSSSSTSSESAGNHTDLTPTTSSTTTLSKVFVTWGARAVEVGGPVQDLRALLFRHMQPWRASQLLHVGITDEYSTALQRRKWGGKASDQIGLVYLQWCKLQETGIKELHGGSKGSKSNSGDFDDEDLNESDLKIARLDYYFGDYCETMWFGRMTGSSD